jgi:hypothetical protein
MVNESHTARGKDVTGVTHRCEKQKRRNTAAWSHQMAGMAHQHACPPSNRVTVVTNESESWA